MRSRLSVLLFIVLFGFHSIASAVNYCASSAFGYGSSATGGGSATPVQVNSVSELKSALGSKAKNKVVIITKDLTFTSMLTIQDAQNITLMALPGVKLISNQQDASTSGILLVKKSSNVIIRNLTFVGPGAYDCNGNDNLCFEKVTTAWVDHCDFQDGCDGNFDNKSLTDNVTISWCRFRYLKAPKAGGSGGADDHRFTNLLGAKSSDAPADGTYNITWAYCWWDEGCKERMVRCRNAELHFLNCYWNSSVANYYVGPENAKAYFEGCTFEGKANTSAKIFKSYGGTNACKFVDCSGNLPSNSGTVSTPGYAYTASGRAEAKTAVTNATCGAGATLTVTTAGAVSSTCDGGAPAPTVYTVTWNATENGGSCGTATTQVTDGNAIGSLPEAMKSGYTFDGWYTAPSGGTKISSATTVTADITYYAQFTSVPVTTYYTVIWDANGGTCGTASTSVEEGNAISTAIDPLPTATKAGDYSFDGWYTAVSGGTKITTSTVINANVTYYAHYTATGGGGGGSCTYTFAFAKESDATTAGVTNNTSAFTGFATTSSGNDCTGSITIDETTYNITKRGSNSTVSITFSVPADKVGTLYGLANSGGSSVRTLTLSDGGSYSANQSTSNSNSAAAAITFTSLSAGTYTLSSTQNVSVPFLCLKLCDAGSSPTPTFALYYDENGGSGTMTETEQTGSSVTVASNGFTAPTGYAFQKWNTEMNGSGTDYTVGADVTLIEDVTLYAIWAAQSYTVTLDAAGGIGGSTSVNATFDEAMPSITIPSQSGYIFKGYYSGTDGTGTQYYDENGSSTNSWNIAAPTTLHAYWLAGSTPDPTGCELNFWFFKEADATANGKTNSAIFSGMAADASDKSGSITIDGSSYSVTRRTGDNATFGQFTIPTGYTGVFYALAISSGSGDRQINLNNGSDVYELPVAGGSSSYKRIESEELPAGTYTIERDGSSNVRLGIVVVKLCEDVPAIDYTITHSAASNGTYTIQVGSGSAVSTNTTAHYNQVITLAATPDPGYELSNWTVTKEGGGTVDVVSNQFTMPEDNVTITATFGTRTYTIDLNNQSATGAGTSNVTATYNSNTTLLAPISCPYKTGYFFDGYYTEPAGGGTQLIDRSGNFLASKTGYTDASRNWIYDDDVTLYAKWTALTVTLTISPAQIDPSTATNVTYTITTNAPTETTIPYMFAIFNYGTSDYTSGYLDGAHTISGGLSTTVSTNMAANTWYTRAVILWNSSELATSEKTTLQVGDLYTVTYDANGGTVSPASRTQATVGGSITLDAPTRTDYTFLGWYVGATKIGEDGDSYTPTANVTAVAAWKQDCVGGGGSTTLFNVDFTDETTEQIRATTSGASWVAKTYDTYSMSFGSKDADAGVIDIINGTGLRFTGNNMNSYNCLAIPLTLAKDEQVTAVVTLGDATKIKYNWVTGAMPATPNNGSSGSTYGTNSTTNTLEYTPTTAGDYVLYLGRSGSSSGKIVESIVITQGGGGGSCYYVTYDGNGADGGYTNDPTAYDEDDEVTVLANGFTKTGVAFKGWAANTTNRDAGTVDYLPGATFNITANTTLYAIWGAACATTPDAPTSPTNGATTQNTQEVSWTDDANSQWEVYINTSSASPAVDQTPTASLTAKTYTFTGLTPSTSYYWWVRSVCDASHKSAWVAGPNFTTSDPTYTLTNEVSPAGYGTVSPVSVTGIPSGRTTSISTNTYTVNGTTVTATPADATAQYRYEFSNWSGLPATVTADAEVTAVFIQLPQQYDITLHTNGGTINSGNVEHYLYGTGATLPTDITRAGNYDFGGWYDNSGLNGSPVTTIAADATGDKEYWAKWLHCPVANSGETLYKFEVNSSVSDGNICSSGHNPQAITTPTQLSVLTGGTLEGYITDNSSYGHLQFVDGRITYKNGSKGVLNITLDCPIREGDLIRFNNYSSSNSKYNYLRHTSNSTSTDQLTLNASKSETEIQQIVAPAAFWGKSELFIVSGSNTTGISYFEIVRSCTLTLDAGTNGGTVGGNSTQTIQAAVGDELALPHAVKDGCRFKGWFTTQSGGSPVSDPYMVSGVATLYAQFEDCPHDGTMYKWETKSDLINGSLSAGTSGEADIDANLTNYLSSLIGGTATLHNKNDHIKITNNSQFTIDDNAPYIRVDLDCEIHAGDVFKSTIAGNTAYVTKAASRTSTAVLPVGSLQNTAIPAALVGEKTLYIWKGGGNTSISYFEITRPKQTNITLNATGAYNHYTTSVVATYEQPMPEIALLPLRTGYVFAGYYDAPNGAGTQYYNGLGVGVRNWDKDVVSATLYAHWIEPCDIAPTLTTTVPVVTIWDGQKVDMALVQQTCDFDTTGIHYSLVSASETITGCAFSYFDERIYIQGTPSLGNASTVTKTITFTMTNDCSPASTYTVTATIRIYPAGQQARIAYIVTGTKGGTFDAPTASDVSNSSDLLTYLRTFYTVDCINGYATKDATEIANFYKDYDLLIVTDFMDTNEGYTNAIGTLIDKKPILSFEAYVAGENGSNWHIGSNPKDPNPKVKTMKVLCAGHAIFQDAEGVTVFNKPGGVSDTTITVLSATSGKGLQGFVINEAPDFIFLATVRDETNKRDLIVSCERQIVFPARLLMYCINFNEMNNLTPAGRVVMHQMIEYLLMTDETKVADCSLVFDNGAGNTTFDAGLYSGTGTKGDGLWSTAANWAPGYNIIPTPYHPTRIIAECHVDNDNAHAGSVKVNKGRDEHDNPVDGKLIIEPYGGLTVAGIVAKVNDTRYASPTTIKAEDLLIKADATHNGAFVYGNKESDVRATVQYYSRGDAANTANPVWQYMGIPFQASKTAISMYYEAWMCRWAEGSTDGLGGLWQWVDNYDVLVPFEGYCITQSSTKTYTNTGKLNAPITTVIPLDNRDDEGFAFAANSWTAPIKIQEMADDDFVNAERSIYIYHSGTYASWDTNKDAVINTDESAAVPAPGQYVVIPIHSSPYLGVDSVIPAMQGFFVKTTDADASLSLVYNRVVYDATYFKTSTQPMRAPSRAESEPEVMVLNVVGNSYGDRVHILARGDFSDEYEDGWDGRKIEGDAAAPKLAVVKQAGEMAVAAIESADGRYLSFRAGEDSIYTFSFNYAGETLYLYDQLTETATEIRTGNTYTFEATNETPFHRFLITSNPPKTPTDIESLESESLKLRGAEKFIQDDKLFILYKGVVYDARGARITGRKEAVQ